MQQKQAYSFMTTLLTFTGFHDPFSLGLVGDEEQVGPILSLVAAREFDRVILFSTPNTEQNTVSTESELKSRHPQVKVETRWLPLEDPTDYVAVLRGLRLHLPGIVEEVIGSEIFISVASGTPQMHACWVLLAASGEIPARILHVRPPRFVTRDHPMVSEVDLTKPEFPAVRSNVLQLQPVDSPVPDVSGIIRELGIVGEHPSLQSGLETAAALAPSDCSILILGETGTGKELVARFIHRVSARNRKPFVPLNCAAIPVELAESLLFGHRKGAFTGAMSDQAGKFVQAHGGTLFLDEIGDLPPSAQAKLLRVLQDGTIDPLGGKNSQKVDVRVVAATNVDLVKEIQEKRFREDLYYRLTVGLIQLPALRERRSDIPKIALHVLDGLNQRLRMPRRLSPGALVRLQNHPWPGNIRDLQNVLERSALLTRKEVLEADDLQMTLASSEDTLSGLPEPHEGFSLQAYLERVRDQLFRRALEITGSNQSEASRLLGVSPQAVSKFVQNKR
ncbi:MAG: RNA repair transcriptional activator RtcR family protein [Acidobacteriota bacterium]